MEPVTLNLSIKNVPEETVRWLRDRAARRRRSLQGELLSIVESAARAERIWSPAEALAEVRRLGVITPGESAQMVRADRDGH